MRIEFARRVRAGDSTAEIAAEHGVDRSMVNHYTRHVPRPAARGARRKADYQTAARLSEQLGTLAAAERLGISLRTVEKARQVVREGRA
jgi:DNA-binding CsgD family transcriptional regulator